MLVITAFDTSSPLPCRDYRTFRKLLFFRQKCRKRIPSLWISSRLLSLLKPLKLRPRPQLVFEHELPSRGVLREGHKFAVIDIAQVFKVFDRPMVPIHRGLALASLPRPPSLKLLHVWVAFKRTISSKTLWPLVRVSQAHTRLASPPRLRRPSLQTASIDSH